MTGDPGSALLIDVLTTTSTQTTAHAVAARADVRIAELGKALAHVLLGPEVAAGAEWHLVGRDGDRWPADATLRDLRVFDGTTVRLVAG